MQYHIVLLASLLSVVISSYAYGENAPRPPVIIQSDGADLQRLAWEDVGHRGSLAEYNGPTRIVSDNAVVEGVVIRDQITVAADNVTFRNCHFTGSSRYLLDHSDGFDFTGAGLLIEDCTFEGSYSSAILLGAGDITIRRSRFRDSVTDFIKTFTRPSGSTVLIESSYFSHLGGLPNDSDSHADAISIRSVSGTRHIIRGCTLDLPSSPNRGAPIPGGYVASRGNSSTKASLPIFAEHDDGNDFDVLVENSYINGANYSVQADSEIIGQLIVRNNEFGLDFNFGVWSGPWTKYGNRWADSGYPDSSRSVGNWSGPWDEGALLPGQSSGN